MRLLIFLLALMSAFFVSKSYAQIERLDLNDLKDPKVQIEDCFHHTLNFGSSYTAYSCNQNPSEAWVENCEQIAGQFQQFTSEGQTYYKVECPLGTNRAKIYWHGNGYDEDEGISDRVYIGGVVKSTPNPTCPPDGFPDHDIEYATGPDAFKCAKLLPEPEDCPAGYHSKNVSKALGGTECVPKDCPEIGSGTSLYSSKLTGGVPFSGSGMYCNDGCAYSVPESNITSEKYALGVSQGAACGDKPYDNKKLSEKDDGSSCELASNGDISIITCTDPATPPDGEEPPKPDEPLAPVDNDDLKKDATKTPDKPLLDCSPEDVACQIENLKIQAENNTKNLQQDQTDRFNATLDSDTRNTNAIIGSIEAFHTTVLVQGQKTETNAILGRSQIERLIIAVENGGSSTGGGGDGSGTGGGGGGGGGGSGTGGGDGDGDGEPCEGSASDCVPIEGAELSIEEVNLEQYADKYDDWLRDAELPTEKCITLTTGRSVCLSFEYYIIFFQAISGLIVMAGLLHSGRIISGAI